MRRTIASQIVVILLLGCPVGVLADIIANDRFPMVLTLSEAIQFGLAHYPAIRAAVARVSAAQSGIDLSRTAYLPRMEMGYQANRGTFNNVSGLWFLNPFTQPISGPDLGKRRVCSG